MFARLVPFAAAAFALAACSSTATPPLVTATPAPAVTAPALPAFYDTDTSNTLVAANGGTATVTMHASDGSTTYTASANCTNPDGSGISVSPSQSAENPALFRVTGSGPNPASCTVTFTDDRGGTRTETFTYITVAAASATVTRPKATISVVPSTVNLTNANPAAIVKATWTSGGSALNAGLTPGCNLGIAQSVSVTPRSASGDTVYFTLSPTGTRFSGACSLVLISNDGASTASVPVTVNMNAVAPLNVAVVCDGTNRVSCPPGAVGAVTVSEANYNGGFVPVTGGTFDPTAGPKTGSCFTSWANTPTLPLPVGVPFVTNPSTASGPSANFSLVPAPNFRISRTDFHGALPVPCLALFADTNGQTAAASMLPYLPVP